MAEPTMTQAPSSQASRQAPIPVPPSVHNPKRKLGIIGAIVGLVALAIILGLGYLLFTHPDTTSILRDIALILVALGTLILILLGILAIVLLIALLLTLENKIIPILENTNETLNTVRGTTSFLGEHLVSPTIQVAGYMAGARRLIKGIAELWPRRSRREAEQAEE